MTDWQERITAGTDPSVRAEHLLRYRVAGPIVRGAATWCDLGCGEGLAAASATEGPYDGRLVLVDVDEAAVVQAAAHLAAPDTARLAADLNDAAGRAAVRAAVLEGPAPRAITCFEVLEHVRDLTAVVSLLVELATEHETTVVLSVPNDAFWAIENPFHETMWSAAAFAELRAMLPAGHVFAEQVPLRGSRIGVRTAPAPDAAASVQSHDGAAASHFLAAFGPAADRLRSAAAVFEADQLGERRWIRERESHLAHLEAVAAQLEDWRRYIHELEDRLGLPRAGSEAAIANEHAAGLVKVAFLVNDLQLSGGIGVVVSHALQLVRHHGFEVSLVLVREQDDPHWGYEPLAELRILSLAQACEERYDIAIATWWETTLSLFDVPAERHAYFVQSLEDRFYKPHEAERLGAGLTLDLPVAFITEASWIADTLRELRPDALCMLVRNGIDKAAFQPPEHVDVRLDGPLRVLVEGNPRSWFKHVHDAIDATAAMREPHHLTVVCGDRTGLGDVRADRIVGPLTTAEMATLYGDSDVLVKLSSVEGMYGPPLEAFHRAATCVTTPVSGHDEYIEHGWNALVCDWGDPTGTARALDLLARDRRLLHFLRVNALHTARGWPDWEQQGSLMALALRRIRDAPAPDATTAARALAADLAAGVQVYAAHMQQRSEFAHQATLVSRLRKHPALVWARGVRDQRWARALTWPLRRLLPGTLRRLLGP